MKSTKDRQKGIITIEASLVFFLFVMGYIYINYMALSSHVESNIKKALNETCLELANYGQVLDNTRALEYVSKSDSSNLLKELSEKGEKLLKEEDFSIDKTIKEIKEALIDAGDKKAKEIAYNKLLRAMLKKNLPRKDYLEKVYIKNGARGLDFSKSRMFDKGDIDLILEYEFSIELVKGIRISRKVGQEAFVTSKLEFAEKVNNNSNSDQENKEDSIWQETNFKRGKYLASYVRSLRLGQVLKSGQGLDIYNQKENTLYQFHSVNIFSKSYSHESGGSYQLKEAELEKLFMNFANKMSSNIAKLGGRALSDQGQDISFMASPNRVILLVLPNEAKDFEERLLDIAAKVKGYSFKLIYKENAL